MADHPRFGPAGVPPFFRIIGAQLANVPALLREEGLDAFEYQAVRWGQKPQMKQQDAEKLKAEAERSDVLLSLHGSYFINLCGTKEVVEASKRRLIACATAAQWMGAYVVVFHAGFYGNADKKEALRNCIKELNDVAETMRRLGISKEKLGTEAVKNMHCHFSKIEFTYKTGERRHHVLDEAAYGPDFRMLAEVIVEFNLRPVVICEQPILDVDAVKMRNILLEVTKK